MLAGESGMEVVAEPENATEALAALESAKPDVALVDLRLPGMDGVGLVSEIRKRAPATRAIILSTWNGDEDIFRSLAAGASGYVMKSMPRGDPLSAIRQVHGGRQCLPPPVAERLSKRVNGAGLTPRELDVLRKIVEGKSNRGIGLALSITEGTVKMHINSLLSKLGVPDRTNAALAALHRGIVHLE